ncbi:MAG: DUF2510 domain-containing protein [Coriobacteriia bacterium]|nr:DUF2510 domain-containing protein [Coriobacteriia bacterium]
MANGQTPAGWYPDPAGDTSLVRYWDGQAWTAQTQPMVNPQQMSSIGIPPVTPQPVYAPGQAIPTYGVEQAGKDRKGFALTGMIIGIASVLLCCFNALDLPLAILAIIFSILGLKSSRKGMAIAGIILGALGLIAAGVILATAIYDPTIYGLPANYWSSF